MITMLLTRVTCVSTYSQPRDEVITSDIDLYIWQVAKEFDLSPYMLASLIYQESRFVVRSNLTQIMYDGKYHQEAIEYTGNDDLTNEYNNIRICGYYLNKWAQEYPNEPHRWLRMWNEGIVNDYNSSYYSRSVLKRAERWEEQQLNAFHLGE